MCAMGVTPQTIFNSVRGALDLFADTNKTGQGGGGDKAPVPVPEFESTMSNEGILELTRLWREKYDVYYADIERQQKENERYWLGKQYGQLEVGLNDRPLVDNLIFEAVETFLPIATRANPEPLVTADTSPEGQQLAYNIKNMLVYQADRQKLRMKLKKMTRHWTLDMLGCVKIIWDDKKNDIDTKVIRPKRLILDPNATIEEGGVYTGAYIGEIKRLPAGDLKDMFGSKAGVTAAIDGLSGGKDGTPVKFIEWNTPTDLFFTLEDNSIVLGKYKNHNWNYDGEIERPDVVTGEMEKVAIKGTNHFEHPMIPYVFLSVFSTGKQPHDETSLIYQNIPLQDQINKRYKQIDQNVSSQNNGIVLSAKSFTKEQASQAASELARGGALWVPEGPISESYQRDQAPALPGDVFASLQDGRNELRNIFGTSGSSPDTLADEKTARGKILVNQLDASRIGGGVTEYIEQVADTIYNWWIQMMYVHYTDEHYASAIGQNGAAEIITIRNADFNRRIMVTVKEGTLIPKDPLMQRNEAMDLWSANGIDPITFYKRLDFPNPYESAKQLLTWQMIQQGALPPQALFPDFNPMAGASNIPGQVPGTGDTDVNTPGHAGAPEPQAPATEPGIADAAAAQSSQLMGSIPV